MARRRHNLAVLWGLFGSLVLHVAIVLPAMFVILTTPPPMPAMASRFDPEDFGHPKREQPPEDEPVLGLENAASRSTLTWIGYREYRKHLARLAEVEQAAFAPRPAGAARRAPPPPPTAEEAEADEPPREASAEKPDEQKQDQHAPEALAKDLSPLKKSKLPAFSHVDDETAPSAIARPGREPRPTPKSRRNQAEQERRAPRRQPTPAPSKKNAPRPASPPPRKEEPSRPGDPTQPVAADVAEEESDATSVIEATLRELGRPLAREGLEIRPRRPSFTTLTMLTAAPGNPLVEVRFARNGVPKKALILESSGDRRIDHGIMASLYRWRAKGKALAELAGEETVNVRIRIVLSGRHRRR